MALTSGFYNSLNGDRKYNAAQFGAIFDGILRDGVFASIGTSLVVLAGGGMQVNVGVGRCWFDKTWTNNDAPLPLVVDNAEVVLNRIDIVVVEVGIASRINSIKIVKGTPASTAVAPTLTNTESIKQYPLAHIYLAAGVTSVLQTNITNKVGTVDCPFVTGLFETMTIEGITAILEAEFNEWFENLQGQLSGEIAVTLANQITAVDDRVDATNLVVEEIDERTAALKPIGTGTAAPSGGDDGDVYFRYV